MVVSAEKTKAMLIISKSKESRLETIDRNFYLNVNDTTIANTKHEKLLGVIIDNNLSWQHQVKQVRKNSYFQTLNPQENTEILVNASPHFLL